MSFTYWLKNWKKNLLGLRSSGPRLVARKRRAVPLVLESLEERVLLAATSFNSGTLTIDFSSAGETIFLSGNSTNITVSSTDTVTGDGTTFTRSAVTRLVVTDSGNLSGQSLVFAGSAIDSFSSGLNVTGAEKVSVLQDISTGTADLTIVANQQIIITGALSATDGNILLKANEQGTATGSFIGIEVNLVSVTTTGAGTVTLLGRGGDNGSSDAGVKVWSGAVISGASTTVTGYGGTSNASGNYGVYVTGAGSKISSTGGNVLVTAQGGGVAGASNSYGLYVESSGAVTAGGAGNVQINAQGGTGAGSDAVRVASAAGANPVAQISSNGGTITIDATASPGHFGVQVASDAKIATGGNANLNIITDSMTIDSTTGVVSSGAGTTTIQPKTAATPINVGSASIPGTQLGFSTDEQVRITAGTLTLGDAATGDITVSAASNLTNVTQLELVTGGQIIDGNTIGDDITVARLALTAASGVGVGDALDTSVGNLEATTVTGGIFVSNNGVLNIGGVNNALSGVRVTGASGGIQLDTAVGLAVTEAIFAPGNITVNATGASSDIKVEAGIDTILSTSGSVTVTAGRDLFVGFNGADGDVHSLSGLNSLNAGRDIVVSSSTYVQGASISANAGRDFSVLNLALFNTTAGGGTASVVSGGTITINSSDGGGGRRGIATNNGAITLTADNLVLGPLANLNAVTASITVRTATDGRAISLGNSGSGLAIDDTEFDAFGTTGVITIGRQETGPGANSSGNITFSSPINLSNNTTAPGRLTLLTGGDVVDGTAGEQTDVTVAALSISAKGTIGTTVASGDLNVAVGSLAAQSTVTGDIVITNSGAVTIPAIGIGSTTGVSTTTGDVVLSASSIIVAAPVNARGNSDVSLTATTGDLAIQADVLSTNATTGNAGDGSGMISLTASAGAITTNGSGVVGATAGAADVHGETGIGASGINGAVEFNVGALSTNTNSADQYLKATNTVTWNNSNAGAGTITLLAGQFNIATLQTITFATLDVDSGATLGGTGSTSLLGTVNVLSGGAVSPGFSPGNLSTGSVAFNSGSGYVVEVNGTGAGAHDQLTVSGGVTLNGATLSISGTITSSVGQKILLIQNDGSDPVVGTFDGLSEGANITINGVTFAVSYVDGVNNNDVTLTEVATGTVQFTTATATVGENSGSQSVTVSLTGTGILTHDVTVAVNATSGTATISSDASLTTTLVTFAAGTDLSTNPTQDVTFNVVSDQTVEGDEQFTISLGTISTLGDAISAGATTSNLVTITDDDTDTLSIAAPLIAETNGSQSVTFTVTSPNGVQGGFDVAISTTDGTADSSDYALVTTTVHFSGNAGETHLVTVTINGDAVVEGNETFGVVLGTVSGTSATQIAAITSGASATGTINNDDVDTLSISAPVITESNADQAVTFTVTSPAAVDGGFDVAISTTNGTAGSSDFALVTTNVHFTGTAGETHLITVTVKGDTTVEDDETFSVVLGAISNTTAIAGITTGASATGTIDNDDTATYTISDATITEGGNLAFTVSLSNPVDVDTTVNVTFTDGTTAAGDFNHATVPVTFTAGSNASQVILVSTVDNTVVNADKTLTASLALATPLTGGRLSDTTDMGTGTITNDDVATYTISDATVTEGGDLSFTVSLSNPVDVDTTVNVTFTNGTTSANDFDHTLIPVTFLAGSTSAQVIMVPTVADTTVETNETLTANLALSTPLTGGRLSDTTDTGAGTVTDNDTATFTINNVTAGEGAGTLVFDLATDKPLDVDVTIDVIFTNGSATGGDYTSTTQHITFLAGETSKQVSVAINDDNIVEATESFSVALSTATPLGGRSVNLSDTGTGTITDNDAATFTIDDVTVSEEAGPLVFTLVTDKPLDIDVTIDVTFTAGSATGGGTDFTSATQQITFLAGETSKPVSIAINNDAIVEATETFTVALGTGTALGGRSVTTSDTATGTITDNDVATVSIAKVTDGAEGASPTSGKFRITQSSVSSTDTVVNYTVSGTATPGAGNDYTTLTGTATIPAGQTTVDINVAVLNDALIESTETVIVTLTGFGAHDPDITLGTTEATVNITDSDTPTITSGATASVVENTPATTVVLNVDADPTPLAPGHAFSYSLSGPDAALFNIDSATGEIRFNTSPNFDVPADQDTNNVYQVTVTVTADTTPVQATSQNLTITVTPVNDIAPVFTNPTPTFSIAENSADGTVVGSVPATDGDLPAQTLTYSIISGNLGGAFTINPATGQITVAASTSLNFEQVMSFTLVVRVTDNTPTALTADATVTINVTNVVEAPTITVANPEGTYHVGRFPAMIFTESTYTYDDVAHPNYEGAKLTVSIVSGRSRKDKLTLIEQGESAGQINTKGHKLFVGSTQIGTFNGGKGRDADLVVTLNANATTAAVASLIRRVNFQAKDGVGTVRAVHVQITNIAGVDSNIATRDMNVVARVK